MDTTRFSEIEASFTRGTWPSPGAPTKVAQVALARMAVRYMVSHQGILYGWNGSHYAPVTDSSLDAMLTQMLTDAIWMEPGKDGPKPKPWNPDKRKKQLVIHEMKAITHIDEGVTQGSYIGDSFTNRSSYQANTVSELLERSSDGSMIASSSNGEKITLIPSVFNLVGRRAIMESPDGVKTSPDLRDSTDTSRGYQEPSEDITPAWMATSSARRLNWYAYPSNPNYFFTYNVDARVLDEGENEGWVYEMPCPNWHAFLKSVWPDEPESIALLQEVFGYLLSGRTDLQKAFMIVGKPRSGKGTISKVLTALLGASNVASPTLRGLTDDAQKSTLIGKTLATVGDAGSPGKAASELAEVIKTITGEDPITINRKYMNAWAGKLSARFLILSNAVPRFADESGVIASRFAILHTAISHAGSEDFTLLDKLLSELAGILTWALEGLDRLDRNNGRFTEPESAKIAKNSLRSMSNAKLIFGAEFISRDETGTARAKDVYESWRTWCEQNGEKPGPASHFGSWVAEEYGVRVMHPRENGRQVNTYMGIKLSDDAPGLRVDPAETNWAN